MGRTFRQRPLLPGTVVQRGDSPSHQRLGISCNNQDDRVLGPQQPTHLALHRQRGGEICYKQSPIKSPSDLSSPNHAMSPPKVPQPQHHGLQDPLVSKLDSGHTQLRPPSTDGMVSPTGSLQQDNSLEGSSRSGPNGNNSQQESRSICIPSSSSSSYSHRREIGGLKQMDTSVCLPPEVIHNAASPQAPLIPVPRGSRGSLATNSSLVPRTIQKGRRPFTTSRPAQTIRTLRKSFKWLPKL